MHRKAWVTVILAIFLLTTVTPSLAKSNVSSTTIHQNAVQYLINNYNPTIGLIPLTNGSNTYWLVSDNLLAYYSLRNDDPTISNEIVTTLKNYVTSYNLPHDSNGLPISFKHEAVVGDVLPNQLNNSITYYPNASDNRVQIEIANGTQALGWQNCADWLALEGISFFNNNQSSEATSLYNQLMAKWNGYGFADNAFLDRVNSNVMEYDTYKLGLALILAKDLQINNATFTSQSLSILKQCQLPDGGILTYYNFTGGQYVGLTTANTETTSIIAIATETTPCAIDFNHDGKVDFRDIVYLVDAYIAFNQYGTYNSACDLNHDGKIDFNDVTLFINAYVAYAQQMASV